MKTPTLVTFITIDDAGETVSVGSWSNCSFVPGLGDYVLFGEGHMRRVEQVFWSSQSDVRILVGREVVRG